VVEENRGYSRAGRIGKVIKGKWRVDTRLGDGATATVYAATHRNGHRVALKVLHPQFSRDEQIRTRFMREAYVGNAIEHPGVVRVLDDDVTEDGAVFLIMELLEGESYEVRAERHGGKLPMAEVVWVLDTLLDVLIAAHKRNIVHRDIKPDNVFLTREGHVKVLDFGFARMKAEVGQGSSGGGATTSLTKTGFILGTPDFMSPEQAGGRNKAVDGRSDLWSAAATAFCLITGQRVHSGAATLHQHLLLTATARARSLGSVAPELPAGLVAVIDRALSLEPDRRWFDASAMRTALRAAVGPFDSRYAPVQDTDPTEVHPGPGVYASHEGPNLDESMIFVGARESPAAPPATPPVTSTLTSTLRSPLAPIAVPAPMEGPLSLSEQTSHSSITARRVRRSAFDRHFSKWIFFLVIATISAVVVLIGLRRKGQLGQRGGGAGAPSGVQSPQSAPARK